MTEEQLKHYHKGGYFKATYSPDPTVVPRECHPLIGTQVTVFQNVCVGPIVTGKYKGQFRFNCYEIVGWFPEASIKDLEIIDSYLGIKEQLPVWIYKLTYDQYEQLKPNFGIGYSKEDLPLVVEREYSSEMDKYVLELSKPQATKIEKAKFDGSLPLKWETIYEQS